MMSVRFKASALTVVVLGAASLQACSSSGGGASPPQQASNVSSQASDCAAVRDAYEAGKSDAPGPDYAPHRWIGARFAAAWPNISDPDIRGLMKDIAGMGMAFSNSPEVIALRSICPSAMPDAEQVLGVLGGPVDLAP